MSDLPTTVDFEDHDAVASVSEVALLSALKRGLPEDKFEVKKFLGDGRFGDVFLCRDVTLDRLVAIKVLALHRSPKQEHGSLRTRFLEEMRRLAEVNYQHVVKIHQDGELKDNKVWPERTPFAVMEFCVGGTLKQYLQGQPSGRILPRKAARLMADAAEGVQALHAKDLVHRDLKPANLFLDASGRIRVGDLGLARSVDEFRGHSDGAGTVAYFSPEQCNCSLLGTRSDIFALGAILYELLSGRKAFDGKTPSEVINQIIHGCPKPLRDHDQTIPVDLEKICNRCFRIDPNARPPAHGLADDLRSWTDAQGRRYTRPFRPIEQANKLFSKSGFVPSLEEYRQGLVHQPRTTPIVQACLLDVDCALVRGRGAAGKTALATTLALAPNSPFKDDWVYYLDLHDDDSNDATAALEKLARPDVLFIIDNVHRNAEVAEKIYEQWQEARNGSRLLMLERMVKQAPPSCGGDEPLNALGSEKIDLDVGTDDLLGVFDRLASRNGKTVIDRPREDVLKQWLQDFGGDLFAFSAAVKQRLPELMKRSWKLSPADAADYVRGKYLEPSKDPPDQHEINALLWVAACGELDLAILKDAAEERHLKKFIAQGIVFRTEHGEGGRYVRFSLAHASFAGLLKHAAGADLAQMRLDIARRHVSYGMLMAHAMSALEEHRSEVKALLLTISETPDQFVAQLLRPGVQYLKAGASLFAEYGVLAPPEFGDLLLGDKSKLIDAALRTPLHFLVNFLRYAKENLPGQVPDTIVVALADEKNKSKVITAAFCGSLSLRSIRDELPPQVYNSILCALAENDNKWKLIEASFPSPLNFANFLKTNGQQNLAHQLRDTIAAALADEENKWKLLHMALQSGLENLSHLVTYAIEALPPWAHETISAALADNDFKSKLIDKAMRSGLHQLSHFLAYAKQNTNGKQNLPDQVHNTITETLGANENKLKLQKRLANQALDHLAGGLEGIPELAPVIQNMDIAIWESAYSDRRPQQVDVFAKLARRLNALGRSDIADIIARAIVKTGSFNERVGIVPVSAVLSHARQADMSCIEEYVRQHITEEWLTRQYSDCPIEGIAGALFRLGMTQEQRILRYFHDPTPHETTLHETMLHDRLLNEARDLNPNDPEAVSYCLQGIGAVSVIGAVQERPAPGWWWSQFVTAAARWQINHADPETCGDVTIDNYNIQLWVGLREVSRAIRYPRTLAVSSDLGESVLRLWKQAESPYERTRRLNSAMIVWLESCARVGWTLLPHYSPIYELLHTGAIG